MGQNRGRGYGGGDRSVGTDLEQRAGTPGTWGREQKWERDVETRGQGRDVTGFPASAVVNLVINYVHCNVFTRFLQGFPTSFIVASGKTRVDDKRLDSETIGNVRFLRTL